MHVIAYYFHGTTRCPTCLAIEDMSERAISERFASALSEGRLEWQSINYEEPGNEHFPTDYELPYPSLILAKFDGRKRIAWRNLDQTWDLARDEEALPDYVAKEVRAYLTKDK